MQVQAINNFNNINSTKSAKNNTSFQSTYPVYYWVKDGGKRYSPAVGLDMWKKMQRQLVQVLNGTKKSEEIIQGSRKKVRDYVAENDKDYKITKAYDYKSGGVVEKSSPVRSFYNTLAEEKQKEFKPLGYLITGERDIDSFEDKLCKPIGKSKRKGLERIGTTNTAETQIAVGDYNHIGANKCASESKNFYSNDVPEGPASLHAKYIITRSKTGKVKDVVLEDVRFLPNEGERNPFNKMRSK